jgi:hypothetical protein
VFCFGTLPNRPFFKIRKHGILFFETRGGKQFWGNKLSELSVFTTTTTLVRDLVYYNLSRVHDMWGNGETLRGETALNMGMESEIVDLLPLK